MHALAALPANTDVTTAVIYVVRPCGLRVLTLIAALRWPWRRHWQRSSWSSSMPTRHEGCASTPLRVNSVAHHRCTARGLGLTLRHDAAQWTGAQTLSQTNLLHFNLTHPSSIEDVASDDRQRHQPCVNLKLLHDMRARKKQVIYRHQMSPSNITNGLLT